MGLTILFLGVALWWAGHLWKRAAPAHRARMGERGRGVASVLLLASVLFMIWGYRAADPGMPVWVPGEWARHLNNLLVLIAFYIFGIGMAKGALSQRVRHPMLTGFALWAFAHLLVRGDAAGIILFGGLGVWAVVAIVVINRAEANWTPPAPKGGARRDAAAGGVVLVTYGITGWVHGLLGPWPFG